MIMDLMRDGGNKLSIKRLIVSSLVLLLIVVIIAHVFFGKTISDHIYDGLIDSVIWSLGFIGSEKFVEAIPQFMNSRRSGAAPAEPPQSSFDTPPV